MATDQRKHNQLISSTLCLTVNVYCYLLLATSTTTRIVIDQIIENNRHFVIIDSVPQTKVIFYIDNMSSRLYILCSTQYT